jgi:formylglycine-generating enzyme required for sulfatase activity
MMMGKKCLITAVITILIAITCLVIPVKSDQREYNGSIDMVLFPQGTFSVQSEYYFRKDDITLSSFKINKLETTYGLWEEVWNWAVKNGYQFKNTGAKGIKANKGVTNEMHPVTLVSWYDIVIWCNALSEKENLEPFYYMTPFKKKVYKDSNIYVNLTNDCVKWDANGFRLPTNAEWEYAARYINGKLWRIAQSYPGTDAVRDIDDPSGTNWKNGITLEDYAWFNENSQDGTHEVGTKKPTETGLYDMAGNVYEFVWDRCIYTSNKKYMETKNPKGVDSGNSGSKRMMRSTSYNGCYYRCEIRWRDIWDPRIPSPEIGFRFVQNGRRDVGGKHQGGA